MSRRFTHRNEGFECAACGRQVPPRAVSCRNHCPYCLTSRHVDIAPGDRANPCGGLMDLVAGAWEGRRGMLLTFRCRRCAAEVRNKAALDDPLAADDFDLILRQTGPGLDT